MQQFPHYFTRRLFTAQYVSDVLTSIIRSQLLVLPLEHGDSSAVGRGRADHDLQHYYHHPPKVKPEAVTAVVELLMMGVRTPETC